jgi:uncharacterized protein YjbI with pentapeptide repeats
MRVIKPMALGLLSRPFEFRRQFHLGVAVLAFAPIGEQISLLAETAMWAFLGENLPPDMPLDTAMPKQGSEFVAIATAFAPGGEPVTTLRAGIMLGSRIKTLNIIGDRLWDGKRASPPAAFSAMPIAWNRAYGGKDFAANPLGVAADADHATAQQPVKLPNIIDPAPGDAGFRHPAGFAAIDQMWPQRAKLCGTHDDAWLKQDFPGFARDIDWRFFNIAPADQQFAEALAGDEPYAFEHLHPARPLITGRLPGIAPRLFATRRGSPDFMEIPLRLTTVWFFPAALRMVLVHHGRVAVAEEDAGDIEHLVVGADPLGSLRPAETFQDVMRMRTDKSKGGGAHALNDALLVPREWLVPDPVIEDQKKLLMGEGIMLSRMRPRMEREHAKMRAELIEKGLDPDQVMKPLPPEEPPPSLEEIPAMLDKMLLQAKEHETTLHAELAKSEAELAPLLATQGISIEEMRAKREAKPKGPPSFSAAALRAELAAAVARFRGIGAEAAELEAQLADPETQARWEKAEADLREAYRLIGHHQDRPDPLPAATNEKRRSLIADAASARQHYDFAGADLRGCDFRNADLSGICLDGATLKGCDFSGARLRNAVLAHADLQECRFDKADLAGANLGRADLRGAALRGAVLTNSVLAGADFTGADLTGANLEGADLAGIYIAIARFRQITGGALKVMKMSLAGWDAAGAQLDKALFLDVNLMNADFSFASLAGASFIGCRMRGVNFSGANLAGAKFVNQCEASAVQFSGANLTGAMLRETDLRGGDFSGANLTDADFSKTDLTQARLRRICAIRARFTAADLTGADGRFANFMNADLSRADLRGAILDDANMYEANLARVKLDQATSRARMRMTRARTLPYWEPA